MITKLSDVPKDRPVSILYVRLSREEQAKGDGRERQVGKLEGWCRNNGIKPTAMLEDIGFSAYDGTHMRKGELGRLVEAIERGRIAQGSELILENLDRFSRQSPIEAVHLFSGILMKGVSVVCIDDAQRYSADGDSMKRLMTLLRVSMSFGRSNSESETKSGRVSDVWQKKIASARETGKPHGQRCPAWIYLKDGAYHLHAERAQTVRWMFEQAIAGRGRRQITKDLAAREKPWTKPNKRNPKPAWTDSYVHKILTGCEAYGDYRPSIIRNGSPKIWLEPIPDYYPAVVDRATAAKARAASGLRFGSGGRKGAFKNILQGLCRCAACGKGMTLEDKGRRSSGPKLICQRATVGACEHRFRYDYDMTCISVIFTIKSQADQLLRDSRDRMEGFSSDLEVRQAELVDTVARMDRLGRRMQEVDDDTGLLTTQFKDLQERRRSLLAEIEDLRRQIAGKREVVEQGALPAFLEFHRRLAEVPEAEGPAARNAVNQKLRAIVKRIVFDDGKVEVRMASGGTGRISTSPRVAPRPNPGQFVSAKDASGVQLRRGAVGEP